MLDRGALLPQQGHSEAKAPVVTAARRSAGYGGRPVIEVNLEATPLTGKATHAFQGRSGEILPRLIS